MTSFLQNESFFGKLSEMTYERLRGTTVLCCITWQPVLSLEQMFRLFLLEAAQLSFQNLYSVGSAMLQRLLLNTVFEISEFILSMYLLKNI